MLTEGQEILSNCQVKSSDLPIVLFTSIEDTGERIANSEFSEQSRSSRGATI